MIRNGSFRRVCAVSLSRVLNHPEIVTLRQTQNRLHIGGLAG
jgi:hypothetical protein